MNPTHCGEMRPRLLAYLAREHAVRGSRGEKAEALRETAELLLRPSEPVDGERERLQCAVETLSNNSNTVVFDDFGLPSIMVRVPAMRENDVLSQGGDALHPAFAAGDGELLVSKYQCSLADGQACSLPLARPINALTLDEAVAYCRRKGKGWHVTPFALRMALALRCRKSGFLPRGNSNRGKNYLIPQEEGLDGGDGLVLSGSGPASWAHDGTPDGIFDLAGNLNEWDTGCRLFNGEIQVIPVRELFDYGADLGPDSPLWKAISPAGAYVAPGSQDTLKYDAPGGSVRMGRNVLYPGTGNCAFSDLQAEPGLRPPLTALLLGLYPEDTRDGYELGWRWIHTGGETMPLCGGAFRADDHAGVFFVGMTYPRSKNYELTGFRAVYRSGR